MLLRFWTLCALLVGGATCLPAAVLYSVTDLGTLGGTYSYGQGINNAGQITGDSVTAAGTTHAFLYSNGGMTDLGTLPGGSGGLGRGINDAGQIVGEADSLTNVGLRAFLDSNGVMVDLNTLIDPSLRITLLSATGINDNGQIVVNGSGPASPLNHAFLLTPVPEPGTWMLLGAGLLLVGGLTRSYGRAHRAG